jgi:peptidoglycan/xylan/chitin deacetylase (PgdA/CDA1 family)
MATPDTSVLRLDRWLTLHVVAPLAAIAPAQHASAAVPAIPILMYHSIADDLDDTLPPYFRTVTTPARFARQIAELYAQGYAAITLSEAIRLLDDHDAEQLARKVVLTFDDGFRDFHSDAYPVLERVGYTATVFVASAYIGRPFLTGRDCLTRQQVRALSALGIEFGSHSVSHRRLVDVSYQELAAELAVSKQTIEDITGQAVTLFSYPYRFPEQDRAFTRTLGELLDQSGYQAGVTTTIGRSSAQDDPRFLPRLPMNDCDDSALLRAKLDGHYDWLHTAQRWRKQSRALLHRWSPT